MYATFETMTVLETSLTLVEACIKKNKKESTLSCIFIYQDTLSHQESITDDISTNPGTDFAGEQQKGLPMMKR